MTAPRPDVCDCAIHGHYRRGRSKLLVNQSLDIGSISAFIVSKSPQAPKRSREVVGSGPSIVEDEAGREESADRRSVRRPDPRACASSSSTSLTLCQEPRSALQDIPPCQSRLTPKPHISVFRGFSPIPAQRPAWKRLEDTAL